MLQKTNQNLYSNIFFSLLIIFTVVVTYFNCIDHDFVYDDNRQIERNHLIQNPDLAWKAITSDVWAFKGDSTTVMSNYWRPTFVSWMIVNYKLFKLDSKLWHISNIVIHLILCLLIFYYLNLWIKSKTLNFLIVSLFAIHPIHTESVAWVAGSPDILFGISMFSSLFFLYFSRVNLGNRIKNITWYLMSCLFYILALGSKEIGILMVPLYFFIFLWSDKPESQDVFNFSRKSYIKASIKSLPFIMIAILYLIIRYIILGFFSKPYANYIDVNQLIINIPAIINFYIQKAVLPFGLSPNYPLRIVQEVSIEHVILPLITMVVISFALIKIAIKSRIQFLGLLLLALPLIPTINISAFNPEQIVHDRYLYLPILGLYLIVMPWLYKLLKHVNKLYLIVPSVFLIIALMVQSITYNSVWKSNLSLWKHAVKIDSNSSFNWAQLANVQNQQKQYLLAIDSYEKSLNILMYPRAVYGLAKSYAMTKNSHKAIEILKPLFENTHIDIYLLYQAYELYAILLMNQNRLMDAELLLKKAKTVLPYYDAALTEKLSIILYVQNKKQEALSVLESVKQRALSEQLIESKQVYFRLGMLYSELNQKTLASDAYKTFLSLTENINNGQVLRFRNFALKYLAKNH